MIGSRYLCIIIEFLLINRVEMKKRWIEVSIQQEGIHKYPDALTNPKLADVKFLGYPHRHIFHINIRVEVFHDDRDIEFILFKRYINSLFSNSTVELDYKSCEMLSDDLYEHISRDYPNRDVVIKVFEDGENGSVIEFNKS